MSAETHATIDFRVRLGGESERYAWCRAHMSVLFDGRRRRRWIIGKLTDISQERMLTERLEQQARTDALTGLLNRAGLEEAIRLRLEGAPQQSCAIVLLDIDDFKDINDFTATTWATRFCARWRTSCAAISAARTSSAGWAATSSWH